MADLELKFNNIFTGVFIEEVIKVAKRELAWEVDYIREAECTKRFYTLLQNSPHYKVPGVIGTQSDSAHLN